MQKEEEYEANRKETKYMAPDEHDGRTKWPECADVIGKIHNQGQCGMMPSGSCVRTRRSQAALMAKFAKFTRLRRLHFANFAIVRL